MTAKPFKVTQHSRNIHCVSFEVESDWRGWEHFVLLSSDRHHDSTHANHDLERKHLEQVKARNATWVDVGDLFDCMAGRYDPRSGKQDIRPEYATSPNYFDAIVRDAAEFYAPYAAHCICIGRGNHETAVTKRHEIDLTERLCAQMSLLAGQPVYSGGYGGYVRFQARVMGTGTAFDLRYYHGSGGGGPMTHGVLGTRRFASWCAADCIVTGHTHDHWAVRLQREVLKCNRGRYSIQLRDQWHVKTPSYKDEHGDGYGGWHVETGKPPKPCGATWMRLSLVEDYPEGNVRHVRPRLVAQFMEAL